MEYKTTALDCRVRFGLEESARRPSPIGVQSLTVLGRSLANAYAKLLGNPGNEAFFDFINRDPVTTYKAMPLELNTKASMTKTKIAGGSVHV